MSAWFPGETRARVVAEGMKATPVRPTVIAAALLMGLACLAGARQVDASGRASVAAMPPIAGQVTVAQASMSQTGASTAPASSSQPPAAAPSTTQPSASQSGTSGQTGGSGDDTGGSQPGAGDQGSGTDSGSGAVASPQEPAPETTPPPPPPPPLNPALDAQAKLLLQQLTAKQLDPRLPAVALPDWFAQQIGKRAEIDWTTGDCSDEADFSGSGSDNGGASGASYDPALCTEGQALFYGPDGKASLDRYVVLQITVGSRQTGVNRVPTAYGPDSVTIFVFDGSSTRTLSRLSELTSALQSMN
jgi:hypothetical protein